VTAATEIAVTNEAQALGKEAGELAAILGAIVRNARRNQNKSGQPGSER